MKKIADTVENSTNGKPLQNAVITMNTGTVDSLTPATLYAENDLGGATMSSVTTDEDGYYEFYIPDGSYIFRAAYGDVEKIVEDFEVYDESEQRAAFVQVQADIDALETLTAALPVLDSDTYTPTLTNVANITSSTASECTYQRIGAIVTVAGHVSVTPSSSPATVQLGISLPITSNFSSSNDVNGPHAATSSAQISGSIEADTTNDRAELRFTSADTSARNMFFMFQYRII